MKLASIEIRGTVCKCEADSDEKAQEKFMQYLEGMTRYMSLIPSHVKEAVVYAIDDKCYYVSVHLESCDD